MATNTNHYNLVKPSYGEHIDVGVINYNSDTIDAAMWNLQTDIDNHGLLAISGTVASLPYTITNSAITDKMVVVSSYIDVGQAQLSEWIVTTSAGSLTITGEDGSLAETTDITLYLMEKQ